MTSIHKMFPTVLGLLMTGGVAAGAPTVVFHWTQYREAHLWGAQLLLAYGMVCVLLVVGLVVWDAVFAWRVPARDLVFTLNPGPSVLASTSPNGLVEDDVFAGAAD